MADHSLMRLGRKPARHVMARMRAGKQIIASLPAPLPAVDNTHGVTDWQMMGNDTTGDCVFAGLAHSLQVVTANTTGELTAGTQAVLDAYSHFAGYDPKRPETDQGACETDVLAAVMQQGIYGQKLMAWASPDSQNQDALKKAVELFGVAYIGADLPVSAQHQDVWDVVPNDGGEWGGHCMCVVRYDAEYVWFITWGELKKATWAWVARYVDEAHILLWADNLPAFPVSTAQEMIAVMNGAAG